MLVKNLGKASGIAVSNTTACALLLNRSVACWGSNEYGQIGDGTRNDRYVPTPVIGVNDAVDIAINGMVACAVRSGGSVWCWGNGGGSDEGQESWGLLGPFQSAVSKVPVPVGVDGALHVSTTANHICASLADGTARCWGWRSWGALGDGDEGMDGPLAGFAAVAGSSDAADVAGGMWYSCALRFNGFVDCWGGGIVFEPILETVADNPLLPRTVAGLDQAQTVSAGINHTCARRIDATVWRWGMAVVVGSGDEPLELSAVPARPVPGIFMAVDVQVIGWKTCAALDDGSLYCWGLDTTGPFVDPTAEGNAPTRIVVG